MASAPTTLLTAEQFWDFAAQHQGEGKLYELEDGEIVEMPSPSELHGIICAWIAHILWEYVIKRGQGRVCSNDTGLIVKRNPDTVRGPDIMVFESSVSLKNLSRSFVSEIPRLVVEVLSPTDRVGKVNKRVQQYLRRGAGAVWVVDAEEQIVTIHLPGQEAQPLDETEELTGGDALPEFRCRVAELFALPGR